MNATLTRRRGLLIFAGLAISLIFLIACSTDPTATNGAANAPTGSQTSFSGSGGEIAGVARNAVGSTVSNASLAFANGYANNSNLGLHVGGRGQASGAPDLAVLNLGVEAFAGTVREARDDAATAMAQVLTELRANGIAEDDLQTSHFNISPRYSNQERTRCVTTGEPKAEPRLESPEGVIRVLPKEECFQEYYQVITGYQVSNQLTVQVRDLENVGNVIDAVTEAGGDLIRFRSVNFSIEDTQALQEQARAAAVTDLQNKAKQLADLTGVKLGTIISLVETGGQAPLMVVNERVSMDRAFAASAPTQILGGELEVTVSLQAVYALQ